MKQSNSIFITCLSLIFISQANLRGVHVHEVNCSVNLVQNFYPSEKAIESLSDTRVMETALEQKKKSQDSRVQADILTAKIRGWNDLHLAVLWGLDQEVIRLVDSGAFEVDAFDAIQTTPLHLAVARGNTACVQALLDRGALVDAQDKYGWTPLHTAYFYLPNMNHPCTLLLVEKGASNSITNDQGLRPLDFRDANRSWR